jgi:hypothetical protein
MAAGWEGAIRLEMSHRLRESLDDRHGRALQLSRVVVSFAEP